jgi:hypothetical protein
MDIITKKIKSDEESDYIREKNSDLDLDDIDEDILEHIENVLYKLRNNKTIMWISKSSWKISKNLFIK